jgi:hypothetical protein
VWWQHQLHPAAPVWFTDNDDDGRRAAARYAAALEVWPDHPHRGYLAQLLAVGVPLMDTAPPYHRGVVVRNQLSQPNAVAQTRVWLRDECAAGHMVRLSLSDAAALPALAVSPLLTVPKDGSDLKVRVCANLSAWYDGPDGASVNSSTDYSPLAPCDLASVAWIITAALYAQQHLVPAGEVVHGAKLDLSGFFRQIRCSPRDRWRAAHVFEGHVFAHRAFTFGGRASCHVACFLSNAIADVVARRCPDVRISVFVDDFIVVGSRAAVDAAVAQLRAVLATLGINENRDKFVPASTELVLLGVQFSFATMMASLTPLRREHIIERIDAVVPLLEASVPAAAGALATQLGVLGGLFAWIQPLYALSPVLSGHVWAAVAALAARRAHRAARDVDVPATLWALHIWRTWLASERELGVHGVCGLRLQPGPAPAKGQFVELHTDSSDTGFGGVTWPQPLCFADAWSEAERVGMTSNTREAWGAVLGVLLFAPRWHAAGVRFVLLRTDSSTGACAFSAARCHDPSLAHAVLYMCRVQWAFGFRVLPLHLSGCANVLPDHCSRFPAGMGPAGYTTISLPSTSRSLPALSYGPLQPLPRMEQLLNVPGARPPSGGTGSASVLHSAALTMSSLAATFTTPSTSGLRF